MTIYKSYAKTGKKIKMYHWSGSTVYERLVYTRYKK